MYQITHVESQNGQYQNPCAYDGLRVIHMSELTNIFQLLIRSYAYREISLVQHENQTHQEHYFNIHNNTVRSCIDR